MFFYFSVYKITFLLLYFNFCLTQLVYNESDKYFSQGGFFKVNTIKFLAIFTTLSASIFSADFNYLGTKQPYSVKEISTAPTPYGD